MKPAEVLTAIRSGRTAPLYLLEGEDLQSRQELAREFAGLVDEGLQAFNVESFHANEATTAAARDQMFAAILSAARTLPMMAPRRVLIVHEADRLLAPRRAKDEEEPADAPPAPAAGTAKRKRTLTPAEEMEAYLEAPEPLTTLVFAAASLDRTRRIVKLLRKQAVVVECGVLGSRAEAARWVQQRLEPAGVAIEPPALDLLLASTGLDIGRIRAEVDKLALYAAGQEAIRSEDVRAVVTSVDEPGQGPAVGIAIKEGNVELALRELTVLLDNGAPHLPILGQIRWAAGGLQPPARVKRALELVLDTDLALKSSGGDPRHLLERLVIELAAGGGSAPPRQSWRR